METHDKLNESYDLYVKIKNNECANEQYAYYAMLTGQQDGDGDELEFHYQYDEATGETA